ncbi:hypothetical protein HHK36_032758 [Tetracentron sinense]|uniref:ABC-2 type transporter transmembrane domain-containing protein n=1 Tax=Tetracentron sinense TaxID=13715 RepID=A0A834Y9R0_TETSI|nr:hypothetical protein HHK36_032758 [Tetracentron sinense]
MLEVTTAAQEVALGVDFTDAYQELRPVNSIGHTGANPPYTAVRFLFTTFIALMFGTIFWDLGSKRERQQDLLNAMVLCMLLLSSLGIQNASSVQPVVAIERTVFYREEPLGMYSALPYAFGQALVYGVIVYAMIGFEWTVVKFCWYLFFMYFTLYTTPSTRMPVWWRWYSWACPIAWTLYGLVVSQFGDIQDKFLDTDVAVEDFLRSHFGFRHDFLGVVSVVIVGFPVIFAFVFAFSIRTFNFQRR